MYRSILFVIVFSIFSPCFAQNSDIASELNLADRLIAAGKYEEALTHIDKAISINPLNLDALEKKVTTMILSGKEKEIFKEINDKIYKTPQLPEYYYLRAVIYNYREKINKAIEDYNNAIYYQIPEEHMAKVHFNLGAAYFKYHEYEKAEEEFKNALEINPKYGAVYHSLGMVKYEQGLFEEAIAQFNNAIEYDAETPVLYYNIAMAYYRLGEADKACVNFNKACSLGVKNACKTYLLDCTD